MPATLSHPHQRVHRPERARPGPSASGPASPALGIAIGPLAGGCLLEHFWWGSVFLVNVPVVIVALVAGRFLVPDLAGPRGAPRSTRSARSCRSSASIALLWAIIEAPTKGWTDPSILGGVRRRRRRARRASWPGSCTPTTRCSTSGSSRTPASPPPALAMTLMFFAMFGSLFLLTQYLQFVLGYSALAGGRARCCPSPS